MDRTRNLLSLLLLFAVACTHHGGGGGPHGTSEGILGVVTARFDNVRTRCNYQEEGLDAAGNYLYETLCLATVIDSIGNETPATALAPSLSLHWPDPNDEFGAGMVGTSCFASPDGLNQHCHFGLNSGALTKILFQMQVSDTILSRTKVESSSLYFPYSAVSYGLVPNLVSYQPMPPNSLAQTPTGPVGIQTIDMNPFTTQLIPPSFQYTSMCLRGNRLFLAADIYVYVLEDGVIRLYAGSSKPDNVNNLSYRLRVALGQQGLNPITIACDSNYLYIADPGNFRILAVADSGPVRILLGPNGIQGYSPDGALASQSNWATPYMLRLTNMLPPPITLGPEGSLYFNDTDPNFGNVVRKISPNGTLSTISGLPNLIGADLQGGLYAWANNQIQKWSAIGLIPVAGNGTLGDSGDGGPALQASIYNFNALSFGADGSLYFVQSRSQGFEGSRVRRVDAQGTITTFAGSGSGGTSSGDGGIATSALMMPECLAMSPQNAMYIGDMNTVRKVDPSGIINSVVGGGRIIDPAAVYPAEQFQFSNLDKILFAPDGSISVHAFDDLFVRRLDPASAQVSSIKTARDFVYGFDGALYFFQNDNVYRSDLSMSQAQLVGQIPANLSSAVMAMASHPDGSIYFAAASGTPATPYPFPLYKLSTSGRFSLVPNNYVGPATFVEFMKFGSDGTLYFTQNYRVYKMDSLGNVTSIAGADTSGYNDGWGNQALFGNPGSISVGSDNILFVADNGRIRMLEPGAQGYWVSTLFGAGEQNQDCVGSLHGTVSPTNLEPTLKASFSELCLGYPTIVDAQSSCGSSEGRIKLVFSQNFFQSENIVKIERPCP